MINAFALGAAGPLLVSGRTADRFGRRRMLLIGVVLFCAGTAAAQRSLRRFDGAGRSRGSCRGSRPRCS